MTRTLPNKQSGLSLVELMIAITLSLLLIAGVLQIFLSSKQTYSTNNALSRVQESGRFAIDFLTYDIRNAGYKGQCMGEPNNMLDTSDDLFDLNDPIEGWDNEAPSHLDEQNVVENTDVLLLKLATGLGDFVADGGNDTGQPRIDVDPEQSGTNGTGIPAGTITLVSDALGCDIFQNTTDDSANVLQQSGGNVTPGNKNPPGGPDKEYWSHNYTGEMEILTLQNAIYYLQENNGRPPSLARKRLQVSGTTSNFISEELVDGIQDMQITYGIAGINRQVTDYIDAGEVSNWDNVVSVRIELLVVSPDTNVVSEDQVIAFNGADVTIANRRLAQVFSTTIGVRNRLP
ncbi:PilW family protein [Pseudomonas sp. SH1-B]